MILVRSSKLKKKKLIILRRGKIKNSLIFYLSKHNF